jgi:hypothetical protein
VNFIRKFMKNNFSLKSFKPFIPGKLPKLMNKKFLEEVCFLQKFLRKCAFYKNFWATFLWNFPKVAKING